MDAREFRQGQQVEIAASGASLGGIGELYKIQSELSLAVVKLPDGLLHFAPLARLRPLAA